MAKLNWSNNAIDDLNNIVEYIAIDSIQYAEIQIQRIRERARIIAVQPQLGKKVPELDIDSVREILFGNYRIIYKIVSLQQIDILTIHHRSRLLKNNSFLDEF